MLLSKAIRPKRASTNRSSSGRQSHDHPGREHLPTPLENSCRFTVSSQPTTGQELGPINLAGFQFLFEATPKTGPGRPGGEPGARKSACSKSAPAGLTGKNNPSLNRKKKNIYLATHRQGYRVTTLHMGNGWVTL